MSLSESLISSDEAFSPAIDTAAFGLQKLESENAFGEEIIAPVKSKEGVKKEEGQLESDIVKGLVSARLNNIKNVCFSFYNLKITYSFPFRNAFVTGTICSLGNMALYFL
jgi:hypothetical protein